MEFGVVPCKRVCRNMVRQSQDGKVWAKKHEVGRFWMGQVHIRVELGKDMCKVRAQGLWGE